MSLSRLDLLIYAHDGRGLGHASRSIAIAMAFRRLFTDKKILFVSGTAAAAQLIGPAPLDWLKLPAYATKVVDGKSIGTNGLSNFSDQDLGRLRAKALSQIMELYQPRLVLVDHMPQGKHKELLPALASSALNRTRWVLGMRGIVGEVAGVWSELARATFAQNYHSLLWYGDSLILGTDTLAQLKVQFSTIPTETGYVCRMAEIQHWRPKPLGDASPLAGVISIPWLGEKTTAMLKQLTKALAQLGDQYGQWRIFLPDLSSVKIKENINQLKSIKFLSIAQTGPRYLDALANCRMAVIYGGYNSITDVLYANVPTLVLLRSMEDQEQKKHVNAIRACRAGNLILRKEDQVQPYELAEDLERLILKPAPALTRPNIFGAETAAKHLYSLL